MGRVAWLCTSAGLPDAQRWEQGSELFKQPERTARVPDGISWLR